MGHKLQSKLSLLLITTILLWVSQVQALVLDWSNITWTPGTLSNSYDIDASNPGNDITITISGDTSRFFSSSYPQVTQGFTGGITPTPDQLDLYVDFTKDNQAITVTVTFNYANGVSDVDFTLFDVDTGASYTKGAHTYQYFVDQINSISATSTNGTLVAPTISGNNTSYNTVAGSGTNQTITGTDIANDFSSQGSVNISYGTNVINSFSFTYAEGPGTEKDPAAQGIGLYDINFKPKIPEYHPGLLSAATCLLLGLLRFPLQRRRQFKS